MMKMVVTDLDGTLLNSKQIVSDNDLTTLIKLGENEVIRVIATGRSPFSFNRVIQDDFPIDYLVFSSGTGVMDFRTKEILFAKSLDQAKVRELALMFRSLGLSFKVLAPVPNNHQYLFHKDGDLHPDFIKRMEFYRGFETPISFDPPNFGEASQILVILPPDVRLFEDLRGRCHGVKVVRATSPLDHSSIWMEIFNPQVSKAAGVKFLLEKLGINQSQVMSIGNDYNDIDMLNFTRHAFVVANTPEEIRRKFDVVASNNENGFTDAVSRLINI